LLDESSRANVAWRVIGQQVVFTPLTNGEDGFNSDSWDGYRGDRGRLIEHLERERIENVVFLSGDVHSAWANDVPADLGAASMYDPVTGEGSLAVEFVTPAVSSPPLGSSRRRKEGSVDPAERVPHVRYTNLEENGFVILDLTRERARAEFVFSDPIDQRSPVTHAGPSFEVLTRANHLSRVDSDNSDSGAITGG
jgi:alkaline phosphatase D